jgi:hypothetical protein
MDITKGFLKFLWGIIILDFIIMAVELMFDLPPMPKISRRGASYGGRISQGTATYRGQIVYGGVQGIALYILGAVYCVFILINGFVVLGSMKYINTYTSMKIKNYMYELNGKGEEEYNFDGFSGKEILMMAIGIILILVSLYVTFKK